MLNTHRKKAPNQVSVAVITVSDTRNKEREQSGKYIMAVLPSSDHHVNLCMNIPEQKETIEQTIKQALSQEKVEVVIVNGGTGICKRDVSIETIDPMFTKELNGFGELFRYLSYEL